MDINRNQFFLFGTVILFLGIQFRSIDTIAFTPQCTRFIAEQSGKKLPATDPLSGSPPQISSMTVRPPDWLGWSLLSIGSVLILHSLAMKRPGG